MHPCYPPRPPRPAPAHGYLIQRIIACEKRSIPCLCTEWCLDGCSANCIQQVSASGTPEWIVENGCTLRLKMPVNVRLCDPCGHCSMHCASVDVQTDLPRSFLCGMEDTRNTLLILPRVQLIQAECTCCGCFRVQLRIALEIYLLRYETIHGGQPKPACPQLPLYPPPMC